MPTEVGAWDNGMNREWRGEREVCKARYVCPLDLGTERKQRPQVVCYRDGDETGN